MATKAIEETTWETLDRELDAWGEAGRTATFWWRDDDAATPAAALRRLVGLAASAEAPLALAVIPAKLGPGVGPLIEEAETVRVVQHGYGHINHASGVNGGGGGRACEICSGPGGETILRDLQAGRSLLEAAFPGRVVPMLVPPWNRIDERITPELPGIGYQGLSTFGARVRARPAPGLVQINAHCDPISWKRGRRFAGLAACLEAVVAHLRANRARHGDAVEPTGLLTHHLDLDDEGWAFSAELIRRVGEHPAATLADVDEFLAAG